MVSNLVTVAYAVSSMVIVLGIMIVIHELGHHLVAKFFGVKVEVFSVGFGKRLWGFRKGDTDYRISALPFGGYVKMSGENPMEERTGDPGEFTSHPRWQRALIAIAGPAMNIILAIALLTGVFMVHYEHDASAEKPADIGYVDPAGPAQAAGIKAGDRIIRIGDVQNPLWQDVQDARIRAKLAPGKPLDVTLQRGTEIINAQLTPSIRGQQELDYLGIVPDEPIIVTAVMPDTPAAKAGLQEKDEILAVNGQNMRSMPAVKAYLKQNGGAPLDVKVLRAGNVMNLKIEPTEVEVEAGEKEYRMGFVSRLVHADPLPFGKAFEKSIEWNKRYSLLIGDLLQKMVQRKVSLKQVDGPIGIGKATGEAVRQPGWIPILMLMAAISLNLGIFNLLPIPILDGGLILMLGVESIIRRDIDQRIKERVYQTAFVFLVLFAVMVIFNDVTKLL
ncbi:MAG TPA: RIP metalloprotease RseP [Terriglobales bacterium]|nr:RIP metalloprotease RseP [Terriglobales bacterium]